MAKMTKEQAEQLAELERLRDAPDDDDDQGDDDGHVIVLRGSRADSFLSELLGSGKPRAGKSSERGQAGGGTNSNSSRPRRPAKSTPPPADDPDDDDDEGGQLDPEPPRTNRYFR